MCEKLEYIRSLQNLTYLSHSEVQTLWSVAWLTGTLSLKSVKQEDIEMDIAMNIAFGRRRYTGACTHGQYALFESFPVIISLLVLYFFVGY